VLFIIYKIGFFVLSILITALSISVMLLYLFKISVYLSFWGILMVKNPIEGKIIMIPIRTKNRTPDVNYIIKAPIRLPNISADIYMAQKYPK
jgi:hypothetical protein